jgi:hypothetical protein
MRGHIVFVAVCAAILLVSCSDAGTPSPSLLPSSAVTDTIVETTVGVTTPISLPEVSVPEATTSTQPTTPITPAPAQPVFSPPDPFVAPTPTATGGGSGCNPGSGALPDGVWFGFLDDVTEMTIDFDLACYLSCDPGEGFHVGNQSQRIRTLTVDPTAIVTFESIDGPDWENPYDVVMDYEDVGMHNRVWIYVTGGEVTSIVFPAGPRGCRYAEIEVEWTAQLPRAGQVAFNDLGLIATEISGVEANLFYWRSDDWHLPTELEGVPYRGPEGAVASASEATVAIGAHVHRWTGSTWSTDVFDTLPGAPQALATSGNRVLMTGILEDDELWVAFVLTWTGDSWGVDTIPLDTRDSSVFWSGAISGDTFAISDPGNYSNEGQGTVRIFTWNGASWSQTATLVNQWDTGNWGSSLDLDGDRLLVGADGATPGPGSPGGVYLYTRTGDTWSPEVIGEGGEGFGFSARIDGDTIATAAAHSDDSATFWVFVEAVDGWRGTPLAIDGQDSLNDWVTGIDVHGSEVAVSTGDSLRIGVLRR